MFVDLPKSSAWHEQLTTRIADAIAIGILGKEDLDVSRAFCFVPDGFAEQVTCASPNAALSEVSKRSTNQAGWVRRDDLFDEAADWLKQTYRHTSLSLICEAGYSAAGDPVLEKRAHFLLRGSPMLWAKIGSTTTQDIAQILRWSRSLRELGVVAELSDDHAKVIRHRHLFIYDILDGDSLACCPVASPS